MKAVIIGDSQAQACKDSLTSRLKSDGYEVVGTFAKHGAGSTEVANQANLAKDKCENPDLVVVFSGSVENNIEAGIKIPQLFPNSKIIWYGSAPATRILDLALAKKVFGSKVDGDDYWFSSGEAKAREDRNTKLKKFFANTKVNYVDYRDLTFTGDVLQNSGVTFPDLQDGIHMTSKIAKEMFTANYPPVLRPATDMVFGIKKTTFTIAVVAVWITIFTLYKLSKKK